MRQEIRKRPANGGSPGAFRFGQLPNLATPAARTSPETGSSVALPKSNEFLAYRQVLAPYLDEAAVQRQLASLHSRRKPLVGLVVDQESRVLWPYSYYDALVRFADESPEFGVEVLEEAISDARVVNVEDRDSAATLIREAHLGLSLEEDKCNGIIADQVRQMVRWIEAHRAEIEERNAAYKGKPIRPSASWVGKEIGVDNKRVERVYGDSRDKYGLSKYAGLPSLGSDLKVQKGTGASRGRSPKSAKSPVNGPIIISRERVSKRSELTAPNPFSSRPAISVGRRSHPAIEDFRREALLEPAETTTPTRSRPPQTFTGANDQMPPILSTVPLGDGGIGIDHLFTAACLLRDRGTSDWLPGDEDYTTTVLGAFSTWVLSWRAERT